jgi:hypothetical protein
MPCQGIVRIWLCQHLQLQPQEDWLQVGDYLGSYTLPAQPVTGSIFLLP